MIFPKIREISSALVMVVGMGLLVSCTARDEEGAEKMLVEYWEKVFAGQTHQAYRMLTLQSKMNTTVEEFGNHVFWGAEKTPLKDSLWALYAPRCHVEVAKVKVAGDSAAADVMLTFPDINERIRAYTPEADTLFEPSDSLARKEWMIRKVRSALEEGKYRPFILHMKLRVRWEFFSWRLVYE